MYRLLRYCNRFNIIFYCSKCTLMSTHRTEGGLVDLHGWFHDVPIDPLALNQALDLTKIRGVVNHPIVTMPDLHVGVETTVGTVIPTSKAIIPASVGVDIGCGMLAVQTSLMLNDLPNRLKKVRLAIEVAVPHGRTHQGFRDNDIGSWRHKIPEHIANI